MWKKPLLSLEESRTDFDLSLFGKKDARTLICVQFACCRQGILTGPAEEGLIPFVGITQFDSWGPVCKIEHKSEKEHNYIFVQ